MDFKRILKTPLFWVIVVVATTLMVFSFSDGGGYTRIDTSAAEKLISEDKAQSVKLTNNEVIDIDLKSGQTYSDGDSIKNATKVRAQYVDARGPEIIKLLADNPPPGGYTDEIKDTNPVLALLGSLLPIIILLGLFWFLMSQMQGGGSRVMQFGKSKAKLATKDTPKVTFADVAGADEAVEELHEIKEFLAEPAKFLAVGAKIPKGVLLYGRPAPARPCWPVRWPARRACRSTRSPARTSSRCSSVSAPPASGTCSSRPRPTPPPSSSSTRSTPWAATAVPASAVATTSASRPSTSCWWRWTASTSRPTSS